MPPEYVTDRHQSEGISPALQIEWRAYGVRCRSWVKDRDRGKPRGFAPPTRQQVRMSPSQRGNAGLHIDAVDQNRRTGPLIGMAASAPTTDIIATAPNQQSMSAVARLYD